jgi:hypothetical protein
LLTFLNQQSQDESAYSLWLTLLIILNDADWLITSFDTINKKILMVGLPFVTGDLEGFCKWNKKTPGPIRNGGE